MKKTSTLSVVVNRQELVTDANREGFYTETEVFPFKPHNDFNYPDCDYSAKTAKAYAALCAGASGYILKGTPPDKVLEAIVEVFTGGPPMSPSIACKVLTFFQVHQNPQTQFYDLSKRETEILKYLVDGLSYKMIADACSISYNTVNAHLRNIYEKLHVNSLQEAIRLALRQEWVDSCGGKLVF